MREPTQRASRFFLAGATVAVVAVAGLGFILGRQTAEPRGVARVPVSAPAAPVPVPQTTSAPDTAVFGRGELLAMHAAGLDAFAAGGPLPRALPDAVGTRFEVRLAFACGPVDRTPENPIQWRYDSGEGVLRITARPVALPVAQWLPVGEGIGDDEGGGAVEAIEAFWIKRPWTASEACPFPTGAGRGPDMGSASLPSYPVEQVLALAQFFGPDDGRQSRRGDRPFAVTERISPADLDLSQGLRLRLSGRIAAGPAGAPLLCRAPTQPFQRPVCALAVELHEVAIDNPATGETLATWNVGQDSRASD